MLRSRFIETCAHSVGVISIPELFLRRLDDDEVGPLPAEADEVSVALPSAVFVVGVVIVEELPDPTPPPPLTGPVAPGVGAKDCELLKFLIINSTSLIMACAI